MKGFFINTVVAMCTLMMVTGVGAKMSSHKQPGKWMCETNASSSSAEVDKKADEDMEKHGKPAMAAFSYAMKHCRDCTKITCTMQK